MMTVLIGASEPAEPSLHLASELQEEKSASIPLHHVSVFSQVTLVLYSVTIVAWSRELWE